MVKNYIRSYKLNQISFNICNSNRNDLNATIIQLTLFILQLLPLSTKMNEKWLLCAYFFQPVI